MKEKVEDQNSWSESISSPPVLRLKNASCLCFKSLEEPKYGSYSCVLSSVIKRQVLRTAFLCLRRVSPSSTTLHSHQETRVVWYLRSMLALTFATKSLLPLPWLQGSSFPSFPPSLKKPFPWLHPQSAVHTEWAVLSQCFSPDPWELWKTVKKAFCLRTREREKEGGIQTLTFKCL